jgi:guanosine-3',5'-bis(diphosphate) 3'-pyrophosphohydrolase
MSNLVHEAKEVLSAALLHDVVEDTSINLVQIRNKFGKRVAGIVDELTSKYPRSSGLSREERKTKEGKRLATESRQNQETCSGAA